MKLKLLVPFTIMQPASRATPFAKHPEIIYFCASQDASSNEKTRAPVIRHPSAWGGCGSSVDPLRCLHAVGNPLPRLW